MFHRTKPRSGAGWLLLALICAARGGLHLRGACGDALFLGPPSLTHAAQFEDVHDARARDRVERLPLLFGLRRARPTRSLQRA